MLDVTHNEAYPNHLEDAMAVTAIHPGEHLAEELKELSMSAAELARKLDVPTNRITAILNGQRAITGDTALRLAHFFGTTAEFWLNLQSLYELRIAQRKAGKSIKALPRLKRPAGHARRQAATSALCPPGVDAYRRRNSFG
jgi:addiction module HigA family antidote